MTIARAARIALSTCAAIAGCAVAPATQPDARNVARLEIAPYAAHEECASLAPGDRLDWRFESTEPVAFNIHYHDANMIVMPITRDNATSEAGVFAPSLKQGYCMMWEAGAAGATIAYRVNVRRATP